MVQLHVITPEGKKKTWDIC